MSNIQQFRVTLSPSCTIDVCGQYLPAQAIQAARDAMEGCFDGRHTPIVKLCIAGADGKWVRFEDVTPGEQLPPARAMYELLRDLVGAQEAARTTPAPAVMAVITSARLMIDANVAQRDRAGHEAVCVAASRALASPRLDGCNAAR